VDTQQRESAGTWLVSFVFLHANVILCENVMLFQLHYPTESLPLDSGKHPRCAVVAKEMLGEAEMTCSFEKRWYEDQGR